MTLAEAVAEAKKRWHAHGGWADNDGASCLVGIRAPEGLSFTRRVTLGRAGTFERAFMAADKKIAKIAEKRRVWRSRPRGPAWLPNVEMFDDRTKEEG